MQIDIKQKNSENVALVSIDGDILNQIVVVAKILENPALSGVLVLNLPGYLITFTANPVPPP